jgi:hypothetical protein
MSATRAARATLRVKTLQAGTTLQAMTTLRPRAKLRAVTVAAAAGAALAVALTGCAGRGGTAVAAPETTAPAAPTATPTPVWDVSIRRTFTLTDGTTAPGCLALAVEADPQTDDGTGADRLDRARALLTGRDWETEPVSLDELSADDRRQKQAQGQTEVVLLTGVLSDHVSEALADAGLIGRGVSLQGKVGC